MTKDGDEHLEKVYEETSEWLRMVNNLGWQMGAIFLPLSLSCIALAVQYTHLKYYLAAGSIYLFSFWVYVSQRYRKGTIVARQVLMKIESEWGVKSDLSFYQLEGLRPEKWYGLANLQKATLVLLMVLWSIMLINL